MQHSMNATEDDLRAAYRLLLGREPDEAGFRHHLRWIEREHIDPSTLCAHFVASPEYRARMAIDNSLVPIQLDGCTVFARAGDRLIGANVAEHRSYEPYVMEHFLRELGPGSCVLDIGANIGLFTIPAALRVGSAGRVIAVEPLPQNHLSLYAGITHNNLSNVSVLPIAASDRPGLIDALCAPDSSNGIVGVRPVYPRNGLTVPIHRLDDLLATVEQLDVVKIDIEGHEPVAWRGMRGLLDRHRPIVFSEFSPIAMRNVGNDESIYLAHLFEYADSVRILHRDCDPVDCHAANAVMKEWRTANARAGLDGELHLDLAVRPARRILRKSVLPII